MANTGFKGWSTLEEYFLDDGTPTGATKANLPGSADYVAPVSDLLACPLPDLSGFASPLVAAKVSDRIYMSDASDGVFYFNPLTITAATDRVLVPGFGSFRATGMALHPASGKLFVNTMYGGGCKVVNTLSNTITGTVAFGSDGAFSRGNVFYIASRNEIWCNNNSAGQIVRIDPVSETVLGTLPLGKVVDARDVSTGKIYVCISDDAAVHASITILNASTLATIGSIADVSRVLNINGFYGVRGVEYNLSAGKLYYGAVGDSQITVIDAATNAITNRVNIPTEGYTWAQTAVLRHNPIRGKLYVGGSVATSTPFARLWVFNYATEAVESTYVPVVNVAISESIYFANNNRMYLMSAGRVPESAPNTGHLTDGTILIYN